MIDNRQLIIDNDRLMRNLLVDLAQAAGWVTKALARATVAQHWVSQFQPDEILSGVAIPETSGLDMLCALVGAPPVAEPVLCSGRPDQCPKLNEGRRSTVVAR